MLNYGIISRVVFWVLNKTFSPTVGDNSRGYTKIFSGATTVGLLGLGYYLKQ